MKNTDKSNFLSYLNLYSNRVSDLLEKIAILPNKKKQLVTLFTPNPEQIVLAQNNKSFAKVLCQADYLVPDGIGLVVASRLFSLVGRGDKIKERIPGVDLVKKILSQAKDKKATVMVIGGVSYNNLNYLQWQIRECPVDVGPKSASKVSGQTLWWTSGYVNALAPTTVEHTAVKNCIQKVLPDVVFIALGAPAQEQWISDNRAFLEKNGVQLAMVVGGAFDMLLGKVQRAPAFMRTIGLEWLYRLIQEPWRWRRQLSLITFIKLVLRDLVGL